ncbi:MAG: ATP-binding protein [Gammaproteobacteria bacterium]|nr:ATP-binding protein [Gammaproteobacteria bacterium]
MAQRNSLFVIATLALVFLLLAWQGYSRYQQFSRYHQGMATHSVTAVAGEISNLIQSYRRLARLYAVQHRQTLTSLLEQPDNQTSAKQLATSLTQFLPEYSDFALADAQGIPNFTLNSKNLAEPCRLQLLDFARSRSKQQPIKIHSNKKGSHFDIVTEFGMHNRTGLFFISFHIERLNTILKNGHIRGHRLQLLTYDNATQEPSEQSLKKSLNTLFSVFAKKAHATEKNSPTPTNLNKLLALQKVSNTPWVLIDTPDTTLFQQEKSKIIFEMSLIFLVFSLVAFTVLRLKRREIRQTGEATLTIERIESERTRIAMDLHDQVLGEITHRIRETDNYLISCEKNNPLHQQVSALTNSLNTMSEGIRGIIDDLHPQALSILGLEATLSDALEKRIQIIDRLTWSLTIEAEIDQLLGSVNQLNLYRILLELSQNTVRHAQASALHITLKKQSEDNIRVLVSDDGIGFNKSDIGINSHGLANIRTRVRSMNADIRWQSNPNGKGTCVQLDIPYERRQKG